jgi:hypothetical protein
MDKEGLIQKGLLAFRPPTYTEVPTISLPAPALLDLLAQHIRSADTEERRESLADTLEQIAASYHPHISGRLE